MARLSVRRDARARAVAPVVKRLTSCEHHAAAAPAQAGPSGPPASASTAATALRAVTSAPTWQVRPGALVTAAVDGVTRDFAVLYLADLAEAIGRDLATGAVARLPVAGLRPLSGAPTPAAAAVDHALVPEADWQEASARLALVRPRPPRRACTGPRCTAGSPRTG